MKITGKGADVTEGRDSRSMAKALGVTNRAAPRAFFEADKVLAHNWGSQMTMSGTSQQTWANSNRVL